ncbi:Chloroperoxidase [Mycena belliarum]|uniref:Chloroperoxidase n=1 Tax=Mycena belliarum TaxID=1033014 RepID=A0AAD6U022_9AGAR|nr:Chloroperoxidase [Mycena belliae]
MASSPKYVSEDHSFIPATSPDAQRSPCPALNSLANHGYLPWNGSSITFSQLLHAVRTVYNLSYPLALLLTIAGFATCAKFSRGAWTLDLAALAARGGAKIAHDASLVHPSGAPSHAPDPVLLASLLGAAAPAPAPGITLEGLAAVHVARARSAPPLDGLHRQIAFGECALTSLVMGDPATGAVARETLAQWFGEERLPAGWWEDPGRPEKTVGLRQARKTAGTVQEFVEHASHVS